MGHKICSASKWSNSSAKARAPKLQKSAETKCEDYLVDRKKMTEFELEYPQKITRALC